MALFIALACLACACTSAMHPLEVCAEEGILCRQVPESGAPLTRCEVEWDAAWCFRHGGAVCEFALRHEAGHVRFGADESGADCYAASVSSDEAVRAAIRYLAKGDPARAERIRRCGR